MSTSTTRFYSSVKHLEGAKMKSFRRCISGISSVARYFVTYSVDVWTKWLSFFLLFFCLFVCLFCFVLFSTTQLSPNESNRVIGISKRLVALESEHVHWRHIFLWVIAGHIDILVNFICYRNDCGSCYHLHISPHEISCASVFERIWNKSVSYKLLTFA